jgi:TetR/AcrR family transcriptional regulator, regulator of autoinduction and epiphytic fitness
MSSRPYDATRRRAAAQERRSRVLAAAQALFDERGYAATSVSEIAAAAGVSVPFVRAAFGGKAGVLRRLVDVAIVGDEAPVALGERAPAQALAALDGSAQVAGFARIITGVQQRVAELSGLLAEAAGSDAAVREDLARMQRQRRQGMSEFVGMLAASGSLRPESDVETAADITWALTDPRLFVGLCRERGWSAGRYETFLVAQLSAALLSPSSASGSRDTTAAE